ncbi:MAG TPA: roadblock/LC7 domain-containing protein, partial [Acidimicrobiales bacterium]|nr:roadblock/LC7 domain-containing protein [Acidimicrobiales bacterium]
MSTAISDEVRNISWLLSNFVETTAEVEEAIAVSSDGLLMAISSNLDRASADRLAAIVSGLRSLSDGAARVTGKGTVSQVIVEMQDGYVFASAISDGSSLGVVAAQNCDLGAVGYGTALLVERVGAALTP